MLCCLVNRKGLLFLQNQLYTAASARASRLAHVLKELEHYMLRAMWNLWAQKNCMLYSSSNFLAWFIMACTGGIRHVPSLNLSESAYLWYLSTVTSRSDRTPYQPIWSSWCRFGKTTAEVACHLTDGKLSVGCSCGSRLRLRLGIHCRAPVRSTRCYREYQKGFKRSITRLTDMTAIRPWLSSKSGGGRKSPAQLHMLGKHCGDRFLDPCSLLSPLQFSNAL